MKEYMFACVCACVRACVCMRVCVCMCVYSCMCVLSYVMLMPQTDAAKIEELQRNENFSTVFKVILNDAPKDETVDQQRGM